MDFENIFILMIVGAFGIRCFFMVWFLNSETTEKAGQRYTDETLKEFAKTPASKNAIKWRRHMYLVGGYISLAVFCFIYIPVFLDALFG